MSIDKKRILFLYFHYMFLSMMLLFFVYGQNVDETSAVMKGSFYNFNNFERINNVIMEINTSPKMRIVITNGYYYLNLSSGCYNLTAYTFMDDIKYESSEVLCVKNGDKVDYDFILMPSENRLAKDISSPLESFEIAYEGSENKYHLSLWTAIFIFIVLVTPLVSISYVYLHGRVKRKKILKDDEYMNMLIELLKQERRITQKEINKRIPLSEAKISLMLSELEELGMIKKIKKGRSNIIYWRK